MHIRSLLPAIIPSCLLIRVSQFVLVIRIEQFCTHARARALRNKHTEREPRSQEHFLLRADITAANRNKQNRARMTKTKSTRDSMPLMQYADAHFTHMHSCRKAQTHPDMQRTTHTHSRMRTSMHQHTSAHSQLRYTRSPAGRGHRGRTTVPPSPHSSAICLVLTTATDPADCAQTV